MQMLNITKINKKLFAIILGVILIFALVFVFITNGKILGKRVIKMEFDESEKIYKNTEIEKEEANKINKINKINKNSETKEQNPINGVACDNAKRRPFAVMLSGNSEAWPLSGISEADLIIEAPVVTGGITRYLAIYICNNPKEIGSIRSARHDFIPLAMGFDAIFVHWGGSHFALEKLNRGIIDNINALYLEGTVFYRKYGIPRPHNGFTTIDRLESYAKKVGYRMVSNFEKYNFYKVENPSNKNGRLIIGYPPEYKVEYNYDSKTNSYLRFKRGKSDVDKISNKQIFAKNVVVMFSKSRQIEGQYNDIDVDGEGKAIVYQNGKEIFGKWKKSKKKPESKLYFYNENGKEIKFVPGKIWIQIVQTDQKVEWNEIE